MKVSFVTLFLFFGTLLQAQVPKEYWQQRVSYAMEIDMDAANNQFQGKQELRYFNNSPDTLHKVYYHLYFNAFQPNSMMDERSRTILDPDRRVRDRIQHLKPDEIGYHEIKYLTQNGKPTKFHVEATTLEVELAEPILPGAETIFLMEFKSQVPLQIRRSGRDSGEGVRLSMTQWYPKMAEYDKNGWHTSPYIGREFYGVYGDFDVKISIDSSYTIGGSGVLQNPKEIGHGYASMTEVLRPAGKKLNWHFYANNVHDFAWAADPEYDHYMVKGPNDMDIHVIWKKGNYDSNWRKIGALTAKTIAFHNENFGVYPYPQFTVIQGGDGGMEYPMTTLITGGRSLGGLVSVMVHELTHMWYYGVLGFNESYLSWMDEGFTEYATDEAIAYLYGDTNDPHISAYGSYLFLKHRGFEEPMTTHSDQYDTNSGYSTSAYSNGNIFLNQLGYIVGRNIMRKSLLRFYNEWKFKHPTPEDLIHIVEKESGMVLDWYLDHWTKSTHTIDYALRDIRLDKATNATQIDLERVGDHPMPVDVLVTFTDGSNEFYTIPLVSMRGEKTKEDQNNYTLAKDWPWTHQHYTLSVNTSGKVLKSVEIDPSLRMADVNRLNNKWPFANDRKFMEPARASWNSYGSSWRPSLWFGENSGAMIGAHSYGSYIFNTYAYEANFNLTSGSLDNYNANQTDIDYLFKITLPGKYSGKSSTISLEAKRYYGVFHNQLIFEKHIGKYGAWSKEKRKFTFSLFHQEKTADRTISAFSNWSRNAVVGSKITYEIGAASSNGILFVSQMASAGKLLAASYSSLSANKTRDWTSSFSTRFGFNVATGSYFLPNQYRITAAGPTLEGAWNNPTFFGIANINQSFTRDAHLLPTGANGLIGYGLSTISPDIAGNNHFSAVIWNQWSPFSEKWLKPTTFEFVSGIGKSWNGDFWDDLPFKSNSTNKVLLASMFVGFSYDASSLPMFSKWKPQSAFIRNLNFSLRMPFFMNGLQGKNDWGTTLIFGVSNSF